ncbi:hypothetical protein DY000_02013869 [Brassica cretica]|uniref:Uncharacterized protein n=1 Tax=Brassica cretica TaxID=69181 RepID=A0ABQ7CPV5_BRACR|nr:hypothetical protein DY000_02013869 [Brassica cretica]
MQNHFDLTKPIEGFKQPKKLTALYLRFDRARQFPSSSRTATDDLLRFPSSSRRATGSFEESNRFRFFNSSRTGTSDSLHFVDEINGDFFRSGSSWRRNGDFLSPSLMREHDDESIEMKRLFSIPRFLLRKRSPCEVCPRSNSSSSP